MPTTGQAPSVIPILKLSEAELRDRRDDLDEASKLHKIAVQKLESVLPTLVEAQKIIEKLQRVSESVPSNKAIRLSRRLGVKILQASVAQAINSIKSSSASKRMASQGLEEAEILIIDPSLLQ